VDETIVSGHAGQFWRPWGKDRVLCELCPRACKIGPGQRGFCFVRANNNGQMVLTTYGRSSGFCIDPIEKKPLNHFLPGTPVLSFGTAGCNLSCSFCQNWDISKSRDMDRSMHYASPQRIADLAQEYACRSVAFTYNDPVIFYEYLEDTAIACREAGVKTVAVTAGYMTEQARPAFFKHIDATNVDLKSFDESFYRKTCGGHLQDVLDTLVYLKRETNVWFEITTLLIPGANDSVDEIRRMSEWIVDTLGVDVPIHFSAFHPDYKMNDKMRTPLDTLIRARDLALESGIRHVYTGNVHYSEGDTTFCHNCGSRLIVRDWYNLSYWALGEAGSCNNCGALCSGFFESQPGNWGNRRKSISAAI